MEKANVLLVEDHFFAREVVRRHLASTSHRIVREATTLPEALSALDDIANDRLPCDVVVLDGDLNPSVREIVMKPVGFGGTQVMRRIREHGQGLKVIGFSANAMSFLGIQVDVDLQKSGVADLAATLDSF